MAVRNRLTLERKSHRSVHIPCNLRQQSGGNDLGEKSCTNGNSRNSRSSCNQDTLAAIPCRSFIVVGLQTGECERKVSGFQTFGDVGRTLAGNHRRDHRWVRGLRLLYNWRKLASFIDMYAKYGEHGGCSESVQQVAISGCGHLGTTMILGHLKRAQGQKALEVF